MEVLSEEAFKTTNGLEVVLRKKITTRDKWHFQELYSKSININVAIDMKTKEEKPSASVDTSIQTKIDKALLEQFVVSINGSRENIVSRVSDMDMIDGEEILTKVKELVKPLIEAVKQNMGDDSSKKADTDNGLKSVSSNMQK